MAFMLLKLLLKSKVYSAMFKGFTIYFPLVLPVGKRQLAYPFTALAFSDAEHLLEWIKSFNYILMATFCFKVRQCIDDVNKVLQYADISIADEAKHLSSLRNDVQNLRDSWEDILQEAKLIASLLGQSNILKEKRSRSFTAKEIFKINIFYKSLDNLLVQLSERFEVVEMIARRFEFLMTSPSDPSAEKI